MNKGTVRVLLTTMTVLIAAGLVSAQRGRFSTANDSSSQYADRIIKSEVPVLIDFWAAWCAPCRMLNPTIKEIGKKYDGKVEIMKINIDKHRQIAQYFQVSSIPAVFIVSDKSVVNRILGVQPREAYVQAIEDVLNKKEEPELDHEPSEN